MRAQDDLRTIAKFSKSIVEATGDFGAKHPSYKHDVTAGELGRDAISTVNESYRTVEEICTAAKAQMIRACADMLTQVETIDTATRKATTKLNDVSGRIAQSLAKTKEVMGPNVEARLVQLERLVDCMERLDALNKDGAVDRFASALKAR